MTDVAVRQALAKAALKLAAEGPVETLHLHDLAVAAGRPIVDFYPLTGSDAFDCVDEYFDRAAAEGLTSAPRTGERRDRWFDAAMARFEAMEPFRTAIQALDKAIERNRLAQAGALARTARSAKWISALAGDDGEGVAALARVQAFAVVLAQARAAWTKDEAGDFAKTMAALDAGLRRAEQMFEGFEKMTAGFMSPRSPSAPAEDAAPPAGPPEEKLPE